jgi:hypothetical protein
VKREMAVDEGEIDLLAVLRVVADSPATSRAAR